MVVKLKRVATRNACYGCVAKNEDQCPVISKEAENQGLSSCAGEFIYKRDRLYYLKKFIKWVLSGGKTEKVYFLFGRGSNK